MHLPFWFNMLKPNNAAWFSIKSIHKPFLKSAVVAIFLYIFVTNILQISECSAVGSALRSGRRGRAFESPHSDKAVQKILYKRKLVLICNPKVKEWCHSSVGRARTENPCVPGSIPGDTT